MKLFFKFLISSIEGLLGLVFIFAVFLGFHSLTSPDLENVDPIAFSICQKTTNNPLFTKGEVIFYVDSRFCFFGSHIWTFSYLIPYFPQMIFIDREDLKSPYLEVTVAHELGHLQYKTLSQTEADRFAVLIFGKKNVLDWLFYMKSKYDKYSFTDKKYVEEQFNIRTSAIKGE